MNPTTHSISLARKQSYTLVWLRRHLRQPVTALLLATFGMWSTQSQGATYYWDADASNTLNNISGTNLGGTGAWNASLLNWWDATNPDAIWPNAAVPGDAAIFTGTAGTVTLGSAISAGSLTFNTASYIIDTSTFGLTLYTGINANQSATIQSGSGGSLILGGDNVWSVSSGNSLSVSAPVTGSFGITKLGGGTLTLSGANTYSGTTILNTGTLAGTQTTGTPFGTGAVTLNGGTLSVAPTGSGSAVALTGASVASGTLFTLGGGATLSLNKGTQTSLTYTVGGTGTVLSRVNKGGLVITESAANTLGSATGEKFVINGTAPAATSANPNLINLPIFVQTSPSDSSGDFLSYDRVANAAAAGTGFIRSSQNVAYTVPTATAPTTVAGAIWDVTSASSVTGTVTAALGAIRVANGITLTIGTGSTAKVLALGGVSGQLAPIILNGGTIAPATAVSTTQTLNIAAGETPIYTSSNGGTISTVIAGAGGSLSLFGPGALTLSGGASTFTGGVTLNSGQVNINKATALGTTAGTFVINGGAIDNTSGSTITVGAQPMTINSDFTFVGSNALTWGAGTTTLGTAAGTSRTITTTASNLTLSGAIGDGTTANSIIKAGAGTLTLSGTASTFTGGVTLNSGQVNINKATALGTTAGTFVINGGAIDNTSGGLITVGAQPMTINSDFTFVGSNALTWGAGATTLGTAAGTARTITTTASTLTLQGVIANGTTANGIIKAGVGTLVLSGANTFSGDTKVNAGVLSLGDNLALQNSALDTSGAGAVTVTITTPTFGGLKGSTDLASVITTGLGSVTSLTLNPGASVTNAYSGSIANGAMSLTKSGAGTQVLSGSNIFTGGVTINAGILQLGSSGALNSTVGSENAISFGASSTGALALAGNSVVIANLSSNATPGTPVVQNANGSPVSNAVLTVGNSLNSSGSFAGTLTDGSGGGTLGLTKAGGGTLTLSGANSYSGTTTLRTGTLTGTQTTGTPFGTGAVTLNGGTLSIAPTGSGSAVALTGASVASGTLFTLGGGATLSLNKGTQTSLTYTVGGGGTVLARANNGTLVITESTAANLGSATGERFIINGTAPAAITTNANLVNQPVVVQHPDGTADFLKYDPTNGFISTAANYVAVAAGTAPTTATGAIWNVTGAASVTGTVTNILGAIRVGATTLTISTGTTAKTLSLGTTATGNLAPIILNGGTIAPATANRTDQTLTLGAGLEAPIYTSAAGGTISVNIIGTGSSLSLFGPGALTLSGGASTFTGGVTLNSGQVNINKATALGTTAGTFVINGGAIDNTSGSTITVGAQPMTINSSFTFVGSNAMTWGAGATTLGTAAGTARTITTTASTLTLQGVIANGTTANSIIKTGAGTLILSGANTFTGGVTLSGGTLVVNNAGVAATSGALGNGGTFAINGGTVDTVSAGITNANVNPITLGSNFVFGGTGDLNLGTGAIANVGNLSITLLGTAKTLTMGGVMTNSAGANQTTTVQGVGNTLSIGGYALSNSATNFVDVISGTSNVTITGPVTNGGTSTASGLTYSGTGTLTLSAANTYNGATTITAGTLTLSGASGAIASSSGITLGNAGTLTISNTSLANNTNRLSDTAGAGLTANGGTFNFINDAAAATNFSETMGTLTPSKGAFTVNTSQAASGQTSALTLNTLTRSAGGGTVLFSGTGFGADTRNQVLVTTALDTSNVGGILPYALIKDGSTYNLAVGGAASGAITKYASYDTTTGATSWTAASNARPSAAVLATGALAVNSIVLDSGINLTAPSAQRTITIGAAGQAGLVVQTGGSSTIGASTTTLQYVLAFGTREAIFNTIGNLTFQHGATLTAALITGSGGITKTGPGTLTLGANSATGTFILSTTGALNLNQGLFEVFSAGTTSISTLSGGINFNGGNLTIHDTAVRAFNNPLFVNADATVTLDRMAVSAGAGSINTFGNLTINNNPNFTLTAGTSVTSGTEGMTVGSVTLNSDATFTLNNSAGGTMQLSLGAVTNGANTVTLRGNGNLIQTGVWGSGSGGLTLASTYSGTATLSQANTYTGSNTINGGILQITNTNASAGATTIDRGTLALSGSGTLLSTTGVTITNRGTLTLDNTATNLANRVADTAPVTSGGGTINFTHGGAASTNYAESLGALTLNAGALTINGSQAAVGQTSAVTLASITRGVGATLQFSGTGAGSTNRNELLVTSITGIPASGVIIPWAIVNDGTGTSFAQNTGAGTTLKRYAGTFNTGAPSTWVAADNARPSATGGTSDAVKSVNTITFDSGVDLSGTALTADRVITMSGAGGGAILQTGGISSVTNNGTSSYQFAFGTNEAIFHVLGTLDIGTGSTADTNLTGSGGLTKSGAGTLIIRGTSSITGTTYLNEGILEGRIAGSFGSTQPMQLNGGTLRLSNDTGVTFTTNVTVAADTTIEVSRVTAAATATTQTIGTLTIGGGRTLFVTPNTTQISGGATAYGLTTGALTLTSAGATFNVANNGTGTGTLTVGTITGPFSFIKAGAGDFVTNSTTSGYTTAVDIPAGRVGWANASGTVTENQIFSGVGGIIKSGAGTVDLTSVNSFAGGTTVTAGTLKLSGLNTFTGGITVTGGTLQFSTVSDNGGPASNLGQGTDGISMQGGTLSFIGSTSQSTNRAFTTTAAVGYTLNNSGTGGATITYTGALGPGVLTLTGASASNVGNITGSILQTGGADDVNISSGTWNFSGTTKTIADDFVVNTSAVVNLNSTGVLTGVSGNTSNGLYIRNAATVNLNANDAYSTSTGLDFILIGDNSAGTPVLNTNVYNITTPRLDLGQDTSGYVGSITGSGSVTVDTSAHLFQGSIGASVSLLGAGNVYKLGGGTLTLSGVASGMTGTTGPEIHSGILALDYTTNNASKLVATNSLNMSGGTLRLNGNAAADTSETVAGLNLTKGSATGSFVTLTGGSSVITLTPGGSQKIALSIGNITRPVGGSTIRFDLPVGTQDSTNGIVTTQANTNGIIGGFATVNDGTSVNFATNSGGNIVAVVPTLQDTVTSWATAQNISDSSGFTGTLAANTNITSLRFNAAATSTVTIDPGVVLNLSSGGVLQTANAGGTSTITGGRLQSGAASELIFNVNSATQRFDVTSQITGAGSVTKGGVGTLRLNSANNFYSGNTSVLGGTLEVTGGNAIGDHSDLIVGGGQTSTFKLLADEVIGNLTLGGENGSTAGVGVVSSIDLGSSKLTFNQETAITMVGVLFTSATGGTLVKSGSANWTNAAANPGFTGTFRVDQGLAIFNGNVSQLSAATAIVLNGSGSSLRLDNDQTSGNNRIADGATVTLNNTAGITADALGLYYRRNGSGTTTGSDTVGQLILNAGHNTIAATGTGSTRIGTINFSNATPLVRNNLATLFVTGRSLGDTTAGFRGNITFSADPGGSIGGAVSGTTFPIFPYIVGESFTGADPSGSVNFGNSFVRFVSTAAGLKPLTTAEYINDSVAPATGTNNVRYTGSNAITTPTAINSLVLDSGTGIALTGSATSMEITSGAILAAGVGVGGHSIGTISALTTGSLGTNPYYVYVTNPAGQLTLSTPLTSAAPLVKSGAGSLVLASASNAFTDLYFNMGEVQADAQSKLGTGALKFFGGTLKFTLAFDASLQADLSTAKTITLGTGGGTFNTNTFNVSFANSIGNNGEGGLTKIGAGSLTLGAASAYSGSTAIQQGSIIAASGGNNRLPTTTSLMLGSGANSGVLQLGNGSGASNQTVVELANSGTGGASNAVVGGDSLVSILTVNQATQTNFSGSIGGTGTNQNNIGITKSGVGSLTLSGTTLTYTGPTSVLAGDLNITGSIGTPLATTSVTVSGGATLNLLNSVGQTTDLGSGALSLGVGSGPAILGLELGSTSAYDHITTTGIATTANRVLFNLTNLTGFGAGNYDLLTAASGLSGATYSLGASALGGVSLNLVSSDTLVQLQVNAIVGDLYWKGAVGAGWTAFSGSNSNFTTDVAGTTNALGIPGTNNGVIFSTTGQTNTALNTTLNTNFFIRDLTFNSNLGSGPVNTIGIAEGSGGSLTITPTAPTAGINVQTGAPGNINITAPVILGANQTWTVADAATVLATSGGISGTANLTKAGSGLLAVSGTNNYFGTTTVNGGVLRADATNAFNATSAYTIGAAGTLRLNGRANTIASLAGAAGAIVENGAASGNVVLTVGDANNTSFAGVIQNGGTATLGLTKVGTGTLTLSGANTYTGNTTVNAGTLTISGSGSWAGGAGNLNNGSGASTTIVNYTSSGTTSFGLYAGGTAANSVSVYNQTAGTVNATAVDASNTAYVAAAGYGYFNLTGGTFNQTAMRLDVTNGTTGGTGVVFIGNHNGVTTSSFNAAPGSYVLVGFGTNASGSLTIGPGGTLDRGAASTQYLTTNYTSTGSYGLVNLAGGTLNATTGNKGIYFGYAAAASNQTGFLNLAGGTMTSSVGILMANTSGTGNNYYINAAGATIKPGAAIAALFPASNSFGTVTTNIFGGITNNNNTNTAFNTQIGTTQNFTGGLTIDTNTFNSSITTPINGQTGSSSYGVTQANIGDVSALSGNSGYVGAPLVKFSGGTLAANGTPASGYAVINAIGNVTGIVITNPGTYTSGDTPTITLVGGGGSIAAFNTSSLTTANAVDGGLTKIGAGTLTLSGTNTYIGGTTISSGTLALGANDVLANAGNVTVNGGTFDVNSRTDTVATVSLQSGSITGTTGILTSTADFDLRSGTVDFSSTGGLAGSVNVTKTTTGTVTLLNNGLGGNFANVVNINKGTLALTGNSQLGNNAATNTIGINDGTLALTQPTTVTLGNNQAITVGTSGATLNTSFALGTLNVAGGITTTTAGNLTKTGLGTVNVTGTTNLHGGSVTVSEGILNAGFSASGISGVTVSSGATLNLFDGATVTTDISSLSLATGSAIGFNLNAPGSNDVLALTGTPTLGSSVSVNFNNLGGLASGTYNLITSTGGGLSGTTWVLGPTAPSGFNFSFDGTVSGNTILQVTVNPLTYVYWHGDQDGKWNTNNSGNTNWATDATGTSDSAIPGATATVVFSNSNAVGPTISTTLEQDFTVDSLQFTAAPTGVSSVTIAQGGAGTLTLKPFSSNNGISVASNAGLVTITAPVAVEAAQTWEVIGGGANGSSLTLSGGVAYSKLVSKTGGGVLTISGPGTLGGGFTLNGGTLEIGSDTAIGTGTFTTAPGVTINAVGGARVLSGNNAIVLNGAFTFTGSNALDLGTGGVTLGANVSIAASASTLTFGGAIDDGTSTYSLTKTGNGALILNGANGYDGLTTINGGSLTLAGDNSGAVGGVTLTSGVLNINNNNALGAVTGTFTIGAGTTIDNTKGSLVTNAVANPQTWNGDFTFTGSNSLDLGSGAVSLGTSATVTTNGAATTLTVGGVIDDGASTFNLTKAGPGTLSLGGLSATAANNYSGSTTLNGGTLAITNTAALSGALNFGTAAGTNLSTLDLSAGNLTVGGTTTVQTNSASANTISIGSGKTLRLNGTVMVGATGNTTTVLNTTGLGTLTIGAVGQPTNLNLSLGGNVTDAQSNGATWDMNGLSTFYANLGSGTLRVGDLTNATGTATRASTLILAADSTILATTLVVASPDSGVTEAIKLGSGTNIINVATLSIGGDSTSRSSGTLGFNVGTGTLKIRSLADPVNGRATLNVANMGLNTASSATGSFDTTGHTADLLIGTLTVASRTGANTGSATGTFSFNSVPTTGPLDMDNLLVGNKAAATTGGSATGTVTLGGTGTTAINTTTSPVQLGVNGAANGTSSGTLSVIGGTVNVADFSGTSIRLGQASAIGGTATGLVDISGGTLTVTGDIVRGSTAGTSSATVTVRGGTLDMGSNKIGSAGSPVTLNAQSGTLSNLSELNGGGATAAATLDKTLAGTLLLNTSNAYTGFTTVTSGVLRITNGGALGGITRGTTVTGTGAALEISNNITTTAEPLTLNGTGVSTNGALRNTSGSNTYAGPVTLATTSSIGVDTASDTLTISGLVSGAGGLTKIGAGKLLLGVANSYSGDTTVSAGTLKLGVANAIPSGASKGNVSVTGTLDINTFSQTINGLSGAGTVDTIAGGTPTFTVGGNNQTSSFSGVIQNTAGTLSLSKTGTGTLTLSGANSYSGTTTIGVGGAIQLGAANSLPSTTDVTANGTLTLNGFAPTLVSIAGSGTIQNANAAAVTLTLAGSTNADFSGTILDGAGGGALSFAKTGGSTLVFSGTAANTYTGLTTVSAGILDLNKTAGIDAIAGNGSTSKSTANVLINGGTLRLQANEQINDQVYIRVTSGNLNFNNKNETIYNLDVSGGTVNYGTGDVTIEDPSWTGGTNTISGNSTFGFLDISGGTNTVTGTGTGGAGVLTIGTVSTSGPLTFSGANNVPTLVLNNDNATPGTLKFRAGSTIDVVFSGTGTSSAVIDVSGAGSNKGRIDLNGSTRTFNIGASTASAQMTINANIMDGAGSSGINKTGAGKLVFTAANAYVGPTTINDGTLQLGNGGTTGTLNTSSAITITSPGVLAINHSNNIAQGADFTGSAITGTGSLVQDGSGILTLNAANTYQGGTTVNTGTLNVTNTTGSATGSGSVTIAAGATLSGTGKVVAGANTILVNGALVVGDATLGAPVGSVLELNTTAGSGSTVLGSGSSLLVDILYRPAIVGNLEASSADVLRLCGDLTITSGTTLTISNPNNIATGAWTVGDTFRLFDWTSLGTRNGTFNVDYANLNLPAGWGLLTTNLYSLGTVTVVSVPEPTRVLLLLLGMMGLFIRRRRK